MDAPSDKPERTDSEFYALNASFGEQARFCLVNSIVYLLFLLLISIPLHQFFSSLTNDDIVSWSFAVGFGIIGASLIHLSSLKKIC